MAYCTVVEFEWEDAAERAAFEAVVGGGGPVAGRVVRVIGIDDRGARAIEVWDQPDDARRHAESSAPALGGVDLPAPTRVFGFEVTSLDVAGA
jgi:hypothetical protein